MFEKMMRSILKDSKDRADLEESVEYIKALVDKIEAEEIERRAWYKDEEEV